MLCNGGKAAAHGVVLTADDSGAAGATTNANDGDRRAIDTKENIDALDDDAKETEQQAAETGRSLRKIQLGVAYYSRTTHGFGRVAALQAPGAALRRSSDRRGGRGHSDRNGGGARGGRRGTPGFGDRKDGEGENVDKEQVGAGEHFCCVESLRE